ncbi:MAG: ABC transporter permease [Prevotellaceae bacterium]|jgi:hypothetical protein|nr:ABC transporter permease [Prevotellaceae bacterium]
MNQIQTYLKQAVMLLRQHRLFTTIYVAGTGLSIALVMTLFLVFYVKFAPVYPEYNRNRTLVVGAMRTIMKDSTNTNYWCGMASYQLVPHFRQMPHAEAVTGTTLGYEPRFISLPNSAQQLPVLCRYADADFWQVFTFRFVQGKPFTNADVSSSRKEVVIPQRLARRLYSTSDEAVGQPLVLDGLTYRVCGVVDDVSAATPASNGNVWLPLSLSPNGAMQDASTFEAPGDLFVGSVDIYLTARSSGDKEALKEEVCEWMRKSNAANPTFVNQLMGQPDDYWKSTFRMNMCSAPDMTETLSSFALILLALLVIPAMNLCGMVSSRMDERLSEMGIRKSYGASGSTLVRQALWENLLLTCLGGLVGLLLSYLIVWTANEWILTLFDDFVMPGSNAPRFTFEMLFSGWVFLATLGVCVLLNLLSTLIPTVWALRKPIIQSINMKD